MGPRNSDAMYRRRNQGGKEKHARESFQICESNRKNEKSPGSSGFFTRLRQLAIERREADLEGFGRLSPVAAELGDDPPEVSPLERAGSQAEAVPDGRGRRPDQAGKLGEADARAL